MYRPDVYIYIYIYIRIWHKFHSEQIVKKERKKLRILHAHILHNGQTTLKYKFSYLYIEIRFFFFQFLHRKYIYIYWIQTSYWRTFAVFIRRELRRVRVFSFASSAHVRRTTFIMVTRTTVQNALNAQESRTKDGAVILSLSLSFIYWIFLFSF